MAGGVNAPIDVLLSWPPPNHVNPVHRQKLLLWTIGVLYSVTVIVVGLRMWARVRITRNVGPDDWLILATMLPLSGLAGMTVYSTHYWGFGMHVWDLTRVQLEWSRKAVLTIETFYLMTTALTKVSILLFYRRMAAGSVSKFFLWSVWISIGFVITYTAIFTLTVFLVCRPLQTFWLKVNPTWILAHDGHFQCFDEGANLVASAILSIMQDAIACALPALLLWNLRLPRRQKIALGGIFSVGIFLIVTAVLRIVYIHKIYYQTYDVTWYAYDAWIWTNVETLMAVVCASAAALKVFFRRFLNVPDSVVKNVKRDGRGRRGRRPSPIRTSGITARSGASPTMSPALGSGRRRDSFSIDNDIEKEMELLRTGRISFQAQGMGPGAGPVWPSGAFSPVDEKSPMSETAPASPSTLGPISEKRRWSGPTGADLAGRDLYDESGDESEYSEAGRESDIEAHAAGRTRRREAAEAAAASTGLQRPGSARVRAGGLGRPGPRVPLSPAPVPPPLDPSRFGARNRPTGPGDGATAGPRRSSDFRLSTIHHRAAGTRMSSDYHRVSALFGQDSQTSSVAARRTSRSRMNRRFGPGTRRSVSAQFFRSTPNILDLVPRDGEEGGEEYVDDRSVSGGEEGAVDGMGVGEQDAGEPETVSDSALAAANAARSSAQSLWSIETSGTETDSTTTMMMVNPTQRRGTVLFSTDRPVRRRPMRWHEEVAARLGLRSFMQGMTVSRGVEIAIEQIGPGVEPGWENVITGASPRRYLDRPNDVVFRIESPEVIRSAQAPTPGAIRPPPPVPPPSQGRSGPPRRGAGQDETAETVVTTTAGSPGQVAHPAVGRRFTWQRDLDGPPLSPPAVTPPARVIRPDHHFLTRRQQAEEAAARERREGRGRRDDRERRE